MNDNESKPNQPAKKQSSEDKKTRQQPFTIPGSFQDALEKIVKAQPKSKDKE